MRLVLAEEEHAGQRRDAERRDLRAQEQARAHVHHRLAAGTNVELVRAASRAASRAARRASACVASAAGFTSQNSDEARKLLALAADGVDRETARRQAVALAGAERAEVARAEEHGDLVLVLARFSG